MNKIIWKIGGPAGSGVKSAGKILAKSLFRKGYFTFNYLEYPSLVRGGHNTAQVEISNRPISLSSSKVDILVCLDELSLEIEKDSLNKNGILVYDSFLDNDIEASKIIEKIKENNNVLSFPITDLAHQSGSEKSRNTAALGATLALLNEDGEELREIVKNNFGEPGLKSVEIGYRFANEIIKQSKDFSFQLPKLLSQKKEKVFITGNEAIALGAIAGGCQFYCAYPMTPSTSILHYLVKTQRETGMMIHQPESEIGGVLATIGASYAGVRSMIATSGGGFALMNEGISLSGMTETPLVLVEVMRSAPATGLPTWHEQGDLQFILHSGHGDFPRVVLTPGDPEEAYWLTQTALNLAEKYQLLVFIVSDKFLAETNFTIDDFTAQETLPKERGEIIKQVDGKFLRYQLAEDGVSPRTIPGVKNGEFIANSDEHNEFGFSVEGYDSDRNKQHPKRMEKVESVANELPSPKIYGPKKADLTLVSWGSNKWPIIDALELFNHQNKKKKANYLHFSAVYPWPKKFTRAIKKIKNPLLVENNYSAQFGQLIRQETGLEIKNKLLKYDGRPFYSEEIIKKLEALS
ncbi:MAG TPA: 2-oxoacid:acceptor oxidoreductase subunit alpha [Candidatus Portnoybacteria bacterium]|nr:2-oxoacid:acceptor oxidoreductase subunit alpha [Candidatus Portnoybacteria bacterium]